MNKLIYILQVNWDGIQHCSKDRRDYHLHTQVVRSGEVPYSLDGYHMYIYTTKRDMLGDYKQILNATNGKYHGDLNPAIRMLRIILSA